MIIIEQILNVASMLVLGTLSNGNKVCHDVGYDSNNISGDARAVPYGS